MVRGRWSRMVRGLGWSGLPLVSENPMFSLVDVVASSRVLGCGCKLACTWVCFVHEIIVCSGCGMLLLLLLPWMLVSYALGVGAVVTIAVDAVWMHVCVCLMHDGWFSFSGARVLVMSAPVLFQYGAA